MTEWLGQSLTFEALQAGVEPLLEAELPSRKGKLVRACQALQSTLNETVQAVHKKIARFTLKHQQLQQEMKASADLKTEIASDFKNLNSQVQEQAAMNAGMKDEIADLQSRLKQS